MRKFHAHLTIRLMIGIATAILFAALPALAQAQAPGSLSQLSGSNICIQGSESEAGCPTTGNGLNGSEDVAVSPDGQNVYVIGASDDAIAEFTRNADGSLTQLASPNDCIADQSDSDGTSCSDNATADGLVDAQAIVISPDGKNVYVAGEENEDGNVGGAIAEFTRNPTDGSLTPVSGHNCIEEVEEGACDDQDARGIEQPDALAISPDGQNVYAVSPEGEDIAEFNRDASTGALSQLSDTDACIQDENEDSDECPSMGTGISEVQDVVVSSDGNNVYTSGFTDQDGEPGTIAEFSRGAGGALSQLPSPNNCIGTPNDTQTCGSPATGLIGINGMAVSPDGSNLYTASEFEGGPIAEFARSAVDGSLTQLASPNDCIQEQGDDFGCGTTTGTGIESGFELVVSPDGADVYTAAPGNNCDSGSCEDVAEFARNTDGSLTQLASPDDCIQEQDLDSEECGTQTGQGLGGAGLAISPDGGNVYVTGEDDIAEFARTPVQHTLTVSLAGSGSGAVSDGTGGIACPSTSCSHAYTANSQVTLTATPTSGSTFAGWSGGGCSGTATCQVTMSADTTVTATFSSGPGSPTPVVTGAPSAVTDGGAGFSGSVNPEGLSTTAYFQYGLDQRYTTVGASGPSYTAQTAAQTVGSDFADHAVGPVTVTGLVPNAVYHVRLVATNSAGTTFGQDVTFTTAPAPAPGAPTLGKTFNIAPVSGLVLVYINGHLVPLTELSQIPAGVPIDTRQGTVQVTTATGGGGGARDAAAKSKKGTQTGQFGGAVFKINQATRGAGKGLVTIMMVESAFKGAPTQAICTNHGTAGDAHAAKVSSKVLQLLHASAHGKFTTTGRYSAATVRGTKWTIAARCDGTLVHDITDSVAVTDFVRHKTIILHAGQSYFAPGPRKHK
jgi:DNA-binding beta-propeller fold protein YncE